KLLQTLDVDPRVGVALPVRILEIDVERRAHEARLVQVALRLHGVGEVIPGDGDVVGEEGAYRVGIRVQEFVPEPEIEQLVVVANCLDGGEELSQSALRHLSRVEWLDEGARADLTGANRIAHGGEPQREHPRVPVGNEAGIEQSRAGPEVGGRLDTDD